MRLRRVLVVDDDERIRRWLRVELESEQVEVLTAASPAEAMTVIDTQEPHLVVLDLNLDQEDGMDLLQELRRESSIPVVILSARDSDRDKIRGLMAGADDYLAKPFNPGELAARVHAQLRRMDWAEGGHGREPYRNGNLVVDFEANLAYVDGQPLELTRSEWALLVELASSPGKLLPHDHLLSRAWGPEYEGDVPYLRVWMSRLRRKLGIPASDGIIRTVPGIGYILAEPDPATADTGD